MRAGDTGYTDVIDTVAPREAIRRKFKRDNGRLREICAA